MAKILLIDDDEDLPAFLRDELKAYGHSVECLDRADSAPDLLAKTRFDIVLLDNRMPGMTGIEFLEALRVRGVDLSVLPVVLITGFGTADTAIRAMDLGAFDYLIKPDDHQTLARELHAVIEKALEITRRHEPPPQTPLPAGLQLIGKSRRMVEVFKTIGQFAGSADPVLIQGETGTGKELVARSFHTNSPRKGKPFVALNVAAINKDLLEGELFGHEPGAFTGADKLRKGKIEYANGGTLFLDEIGDMPEPLQAKLLRVLEYQEVERLGSNEPIKVNVRLLSATHRDLEKMIEQGRFRRDLFYRLNRVTLRLPALRERLEDLPELVEFFLTRAAEAANRSRPTVTASALDRLREHHWPGNVRQLQNVIFRAFGVCRGSQLLPQHLEFQADCGPSEPAAAITGEAEAVAALHKVIAWAWDSGREGLWPFLHDLLERELLRAALSRLDGNQSQVAKRLEMARGTVVKRVEHYGLRSPADESSTP